MRNRLKIILISLCAFSLLTLIYNYLPITKSFLITIYFPVLLGLIFCLIFIATVVTSAVFLFNLSIKREDRIVKRINNVFISITYGAILYFIIIKLLPSPLPIGSNLRKFDSSVWKQSSSTNWNNDISEREKMLKDLIKNILPGKSKEEITQLLGESLKTNYFSEIKKDMIYYLGPERDHMINIDSEWMLIWLDKKERFKKYQIIND